MEIYVSGEFPYGEILKIPVVKIGTFFPKKENLPPKKEIQSNSAHKYQILIGQKESNQKCSKYTKTSRTDSPGFLLWKK
jgi:hypothetical protein